MPVTINVLQGRRKLPARAFVLPGPLGWICNIVGIAYVILTTVLFVFPPALPVTGSNMNYCIVVFFIWLVVAMVHWYVDGKENFTGPKMDFEGHLLEAQRPPEEEIEMDSRVKVDGKEGKFL